MKKILPDFCNSKYYATMCEYFEDSPSIMNLDNLLSISESELNDYGKNNAKYECLNTEIASYLVKANWGIRTYLTFQDVFEITFEIDSVNLDKWFKGRFYCYYESLIYLRQIVLSILNVNSLAAITLIRPFEELSLFNLYWFIKTIKENKPKTYDWLNNKIGKPPFKDMLDYLKTNIKTTTFDKYLNIMDSVFESMEMGFKAMSAYHHTPKNIESFAKISTVSPSIDIENWLYSIHSLNICLYNINILYCLVYPMILYPLDSVKKFGFNGPTGVFTDKYNYKILEKYFGKKKCEILRHMKKVDKELTSKIEWYNSKSDLSEKEIIDTFDKEHNDIKDLKLPIEEIYKTKSQNEKHRLFL